MSREPLLRVEDAAARLCVSRWTIYRWVEEGRLQATKLGRGSLRVFTDSVEHLIAEKYVSPSSLAVSPYRHTDAPAFDGNALVAEGEPTTRG